MIVDEQVMNEDTDIQTATYAATLQELSEIKAVLRWASDNVECVRSNPSANHWVCEMWTMPDFGAPTLYGALLIAYKASQPHQKGDVK